MTLATDYGRDGLVAIGTPQANPTVEAEFAILLPPTITRVTTRLTSPATDSHQRLRGYLEGLETALATFDTLRPAVFGFACTASSYLLGAEREAALVAAAHARFGCPIVTAAAAIAEQLRAANVARIALVSPYPPALGAAAHAYWSGQGFAPVLASDVAIDGADTRAIYALSSADARAALARIGDLCVDAILITGTGMPSLPLIAAPPPGAPPILSSNLALAQSLLARVGLTLTGWHARLAAATGADV